MSNNHQEMPMTDKLISMNLIEFVVEIINYAAITVLFRESKSLFNHPFPLLLDWTDYTASKSWIMKVATNTMKGKVLQRISCILMINNPVGIQVEHIAGIANILADAISRIYSKHNSVPCLKKIV